MQKDMNQADVQSFGNSHGCGDHIVGGLRCASSSRRAGKDGSYGRAFGHGPGRAHLSLTPTR